MGGDVSYLGYVINETLQWLCICLLFWATIKLSDSTKQLQEMKLEELEKKLKEMVE